MKLNDIKSMNSKQKRELKRKLRLIYTNILFQAIAAASVMYLALYVWQYL